METPNMGARTQNPRKTPIGCWPQNRKSSLVKRELKGHPSATRPRAHAVGDANGWKRAVGSDRSPTICPDHDPACVLPCGLALAVCPDWLRWTGLKPFDFQPLTSTCAPVLPSPPLSALPPFAAPLQHADTATRTGTGKTCPPTASTRSTSCPSPGAAYRCPTSRSSQCAVRGMRCATGHSGCDMSPVYLACTRSRSLITSSRQTSPLDPSTGLRMTAVLRCVFLTFLLSGVLFCFLFCFVCFFSVFRLSATGACMHDSYTRMEKTKHHSQNSRPK